MVGGLGLDEKIGVLIEDGFMLTEATRMKPFKGKWYPIFYRRSKTCSPRDPVETPGARSWKGGEEGAPAHVSITAGQRKRVYPTRRRVSSAFDALLGGFFLRRFNRSSHISSVEGLVLVGLISVVFSRFCVKVYVYIMRVVVSPPDPLLFCLLMLVFNHRLKAVCMLLDCMDFLVRLEFFLCHFVDVLSLWGLVICPYRARKSISMGGVSSIRVLSVLVISMLRFSLIFYP